MSSIKSKPVRVQVLAEVDEDVLKAIDSCRGEASLPHMVGLLAKLGLGTLQGLARNHVNPFEKGDSK